MRALLRMLTLLAVAGLAGCGAKEPTGIKSPEDVNRAEVRIGIMTGSTAEGLSKAQFPNAKLFLFDDIMDALRTLDRQAAGHVRYRNPFGARFRRSRSGSEGDHGRSLQ